MKTDHSKGSKQEKLIYHYTEGYIKRRKILKNLAPLILILGGALTLAIQFYAPKLMLVVLIPLLFWFFAYSGVARDYDRDEIYIKEGLIHVKTCIHARSGYHYSLAVVKDISRVEVGTSYFTVYGNIIFETDGMTRLLKRLKLPLGLVNVEELIKFARSNTISPSQQQAALDLIKDRRDQSGTIRRINIWNVIKETFLRILAKSMLIEGIALIIGIICFLRLSEDDNLLLLLITLACIMTFILTFFFSTVYIISEYALDLFLKRVNRYTGYLSHLQPVATGYNSLLIPIKHYHGYYHALFYHTPGVRGTYLPLTAGDIKSNPIDGRRFLVKGPELLAGIGKSQKVEVLYLPKSKLIVRAKVGD